MVDAYSQVDALMNVANRTPSIVRAVSGWDRTIALVVDGEKFAIGIKAGQATLGPAPAQPDVVFQLSRDTLDRLLSGRLSPMAAKLMGRIQSSGSLSDILQFSNVLTASVKASRSRA